MKRYLLIAGLLLVAFGTRPVDADTKCIGVGCGGGGGVGAASPTFTGTTTVDHLGVAGSAPTCAITGAGAAGTCALAGGVYTGNDTAGTVLISTDSAGTAATGTITITFATAYAKSPICLGALQNGAGVNWTTTATLRTNLPSTTTCAWAWNNTSALTVSDNYAFSYFVIGRP